MKIIIEATPKEIADVVVELQRQQDVELFFGDEKITNHITSQESSFGSG